MISADEKRWRKALKIMGPTWVNEQLRRFPGKPEEPMLDLPLLEPPFPSREFCQEWVAKDSNGSLRSYGMLIALLCCFVLIGTCYATCSLGSSSSSTPPTAQPRAPAVDRTHTLFSR